MLIHDPVALKLSDDSGKEKERTEPSLGEHYSSEHSQDVMSSLTVPFSAVPPRETPAGRNPRSLIDLQTIVWTGSIIEAD